MNILDLPMSKNDAKAKTIGAYLTKLLVRLWEEGDLFKAEMPFGNSGWEFEIYRALIKGGALKGSVDRFDHPVDFDENKARRQIIKAIKSLYATPQAK